MSRDTKIKDTKRILTGFDYENESQLFCNYGTEGCIPKSRESIKYYADEACLEACELLYDLNIQTFYSGGNVDGKENVDSLAFIGISYDTLSEENKNIVKQMIEDGIIDGIHDNSCRGEENVITISVPISSNDVVGQVSDKLMSIARQFKQQDVLYGRTTLEKIKSMYPQLDNGNFYDYWTLGELTASELAKRLQNELSQYYSDNEGNLFLTQDLLNKHLNYQKESTSNKRL